MNGEQELYRILDAAANRAREGLRVVEDYARFVLNDRFLTAELKQLRHDLAAAILMLPPAGLLAQRDTLHDVGTTVSTAAEGERENLGVVLAANCKRLQESLRSLEEYCKSLPDSPAKRFEALRYRSYTLERAIVVSQVAKTTLQQARLYLLLDCRANELEFQTLAMQLIVGPLDVIQLRDKKADDRTLLKRGLLLRQLLRSQQQQHGRAPLLIINDRPDLAVLCAADGVHVGQEELPVAAVRKIVGAERLIGVSTHSLAQAQQSVLDGADYIGVGPTFPSQTKAFADFPGVALLRQVAAEITLPAFAIGGINASNINLVLETGIHRVAVGGAILGVPDAALACREMADLLKAAEGQSLQTS